MKQTVTRTITLTKIHHNIIEVDDGVANVLPVDHLTVGGNLTKEQANKVLHDHYNGFKTDQIQGAVITYLDHETNVYEMDLNEFIEYATIKEEK